MAKIKSQEANSETGDSLKDESLLDHINSPADLRRLPQEALPRLCTEIREFLIHSLCHNPGHFGSSMGDRKSVV